MSDENASYVGNQAEPETSKENAFGSPTKAKSAQPNSPSDDGVSIDDQSDEETASSGDEVDDENAESDLKPYIFSSDGARRSFVVQQITRANSSHRPSFTFVGYAVEFDGNGNKTERGSPAGNMSSRSHRDGSQTARGGQSARTRLVVIAEDLSLSITYEPPSPKFHQQRPDSSSYRLKLSQGNDFRYSVRGLPQLVKVLQTAHIVRWGPLELQYSSKQQLDIFTSAIKHVNIEWAPCGQQTARQTAATLRSGRTPSPLAALPATATAQPRPKRTFGSPLPVADKNEVGSAPSRSRPVNTEATDVPVGVNSSKDEDANTQSFWRDNWAWLGLGVAIAAAVTYSVLKADTPHSEPQTMTRREYKLHIVD